jgi:GTP-binding protein
MSAIRNIAIIAHVDHGKTTLVDGLLQQSGTFEEHKAVTDRVMDSGELERERGITILSKCTAVNYNGHRINIVDTPGHADFGGEVERIMTLVDGALLLVDASEGPLPQTRYVLGKALEAGLEILVCINKIDRSDARVDEVADEIYDLFIDLGATDEQIEFPVVYACARDGVAAHTMEGPFETLEPLFQSVLENMPVAKGDPDLPLQVLITQLDHDPYVGHLGIGRIMNGTLRERDQVAWVDESGVPKTVRVSKVYIHQGLARVAMKEVGAGEIIAISGVPGICVGDSLCSVEDPRPVPRVCVDEPTIGIQITHNTGPLSGRAGKFLTARQIRERIEKELLHNVALRMEDTDRADTVKLFGRGEFQLTILVEQMRREGFELCLSRPEVVWREVDGERHEPFEWAFLDFPDEYIGAVSEALATRRGVLRDMNSDGQRTRLVHRIPARGLIGFRGEYLNQTRGLGLIHTRFAGFAPAAAFIAMRQNGSIVADRSGKTTAYALFNLQQRGKLFVGSGVEVYEGMVVGEHIRESDLNVNAVRPKQLTNFRSSGADEKTILAPPAIMTLEKALEWIAEDEYVEVTPAAIRLRKKVLPANKRSVVRGEKRKKAPAR